MKKIITLFLLTSIFCSCGQEKNKSLTMDAPTVPFKNSKAETFYHEANQLKRDKNFKEAEASYKKSLELEPNHPLTLLNLGNMYKHSDNFKASEECYQKIISERPEYTMVYANFSDLKLKMDDNLNAIKYGKIGYEKSTDDDIKLSCTFNMAAAYSNIDSCVQAKKYFKITKDLLKGNLTDTDIEFEKYLNQRCP